MPSQQQLVLEPLGLVTEPNKLGQIPAGALSIMQDCVERSPGIIENIQAWQTKVTVAGTDAGTTAMFGVPMDGNRAVVIYNVTAGWRYRWYDMSTGSALYAAQNLEFVSGPNTLTQSINVSEQPGFSYVRFGTQTFVNAFSTVLVWDDPAPATLALSLVRPAGLQRPQLLRAVTTALIFGNSIPLGNYATYVAINTRTVNGRKIVSPPSAAVSATGAAGAATQLQFAFRAGDQQAGDVIEIYRTKCKPHGLPASGSLPYQAGEEAGAEYQRAFSYTITSADMSSPTTSINDVTSDANLGEALYTNQAKDSAGAAAEPPPAVEVLSSYKGYLFGFSPTRAPLFSLRATGTWGGFENTEPINTVVTGFGNTFANTPLTGASYSSSSTTINVTPTSQLQYVFVGQYAVGTNFNGIVTAVGASSFTIDIPTTGSSGSDTFNVTDNFEWNSGGGRSVFNLSWPKVVEAILGTNAANSDLVALSCQSLKLGPTTPSSFVVGNVRFPTQPIDGFDFYHRFVQDSRPQLGVRSSKNQYWDPQIANAKSGTYTFARETSLPRAYVTSELDAPEAWPLVNEDTFSRGTINGVASTSDALVCFYTDAIYRLSGTGGSAAKGFDWRADPIASGITLIGSQAVAVLLDRPYAMTSEGLVMIDGTTIQNITHGRVHDQLATPPWSNGPFTLATAAFVVEDEEHDEILMREPSATGGKMWIYNTHTDRLSQTTSHESPLTAFYSRALRSPVVIGRDGASTWTLKAQTGAYGNFNMTYATVYADNPFAQRHWQTLNVSAETAGATIATTFNGVSGPSRTLDADGRAGFEVPRNAPAIGNTMQVGITVTTTARTKLHGFAIDYRDHTERRKNR